MIKTILLLAVSVIGVACLADSSVVADLKELYKFTRKWEDTLMSSQERQAHIKKIEDRSKPIISREFAKLADGEVTPLARELLNDKEAMEFCWGVLYTQFETYSTKVQAKAFNTLFNATPNSQRGRVLWSFISDLPKEVFSAQEVQKWLVEKINGGLPAGAFYFILTEKSANEVSKAAKEDMAQFTRSSEHSDNNLFSLVSAAFLASRGDEEALRLLDFLLDKRDIKSLLDTAYVIPAAAMSGNEKLIQKIRGIITTDKRSDWNGEDAMPQEASFAHIAASVCSLAIEGFPSVWYWGNYDDDMKKQVHDWLKNNPAHMIKTNPLVFFEETPFQSVITKMSRLLDEEEEEKDEAEEEEEEEEDTKKKTGVIENVGFANDWQLTCGYDDARNAWRTLGDALSQFNAFRLGLITPEKLSYAKFSAFASSFLERSGRENYFQVSRKEKKTQRRKLLS